MKEETGELVEEGGEEARRDEKAGVRRVGEGRSGAEEMGVEMGDRKGGEEKASSFICAV